MQHRFTSENASYYAKLSHKATSARYVQPVEVDTQAEQADEFRRLRLSRVRAQLTQLDKMIAEETDAQKIDRLASAQSRLAEQERLLTGTPLPGSLRPGGRRSVARTSVPAAIVALHDPPADTPQVPPLVASELQPVVVQPQPDQPADHNPLTP
jgi:hypothetical protein